MTRCLFLLALLGFAPSANAQFAAPVAEAPNGATLFRRQCATCHSLVAGEVRQGPNLAGVYGRHAGSLPGFAYSSGFKQADWVWDDTHLDPYLANPQVVIKGGVMGYRQSNADIRHTIIAYLKGQH